MNPDCYNEEFVTHIAFVVIHIFSNFLLQKDQNSQRWRPGFVKHTFQPRKQFMGIYSNRCENCQLHQSSSLEIQPEHKKQTATALLSNRPVKVLSVDEAERFVGWLIATPSTRHRKNNEESNLIKTVNIIRTKRPNNSFTTALLEQSLKPDVYQHLGMGSIVQTHNPKICHGKHAPILIDFG